LQFIIIAISALGFWGATSLSIDEWGTAGSCPNIGVPACYLVAVAYFLILVSCINLNKNYYRKLFFTGITVVSGLAVVGSFRQATGMAQCPQTGSGFPMCYVSLFMAMAIVTAFFLNERRFLR
jgi:hypothetical protein